uniref:NADH-plastoquinone oxidoreductase subunit 4 n=1 Tax=Paphiopedilum kolopakingii TaxID=53098 RepID=UPI001BEE3840|nr:NADH-plastoquinone oxidoreductase subunit 4 [Paphiopedilum kolopakingii]YP_010178716.1 NADH-plastoquinone oxidoreductase subunit 4 [Paphiopedilum kolopakingii]QUV74826.1 NADH-plastoquinone oxidoreductase subunit 4 [Paphiopedilum kolopakingii]QUV74829.1 NADH-plastoquinone oxidoreductase subunit 4 [Paphiopedilum kolopakingii]
MYMYPGAPSNDLCILFQLDDPLNQLKEDSKWINIFLFSLETGNRWTFHRTHFTDRIYHLNQQTLDFEKLANQSYPAALEIIFHFGFLIAYAVKSPMIPLHT